MLFFLKDNKKEFILWLNVPKVTAYGKAKPEDSRAIHCQLSLAGFNAVFKTGDIVF